MRSSQSLGEWGGGYFGEKDMKEDFSEEETFQLKEGKLADPERSGGGWDICGTWGGKELVALEEQKPHVAGE